MIFHSATVTTTSFSFRRYSKNGIMWHWLSGLLIFATVLGHCLSDTETSGCGQKEKTLMLLDVAKDFISKARNVHPPCIYDDTEENAENCERKEKSISYLEVATNLITEAKKGYTTYQSSEIPLLDTGAPANRSRRNGPISESPKCEEKPVDCSEVLKSGKNESGVYTIWPRSRISKPKPLTVFCDMDTDGGGWTVIQRRGNFSNADDYFFRDWKYYKVGFGNVTDEFWLGNDNIFAISNLVHTTIRFDLEDSEGNTRYAEYKTFWIDDEAYNYTLHIKSYSGTAGNSMAHHNNQKFSTKDRDNDDYPGSCANGSKGGWWYQSCYTANLNGINHPGRRGSTGIFWNAWLHSISLAAVEIKLKPLFL